MSYNKTTWVNGDVITAIKLNNIENGLESISQSGTDRQVLGYVNGVPQPVTLGWMEFSDLPTPPNFNTGVVTGTTFNPDGNALFYFHQLNDAINAPAKANTIPVYATNGVLKVSDGVANDDAVSMAQLNALIARVTALES